MRINIASTAALLAVAAIGVTPAAAVANSTAPTGGTGGGGNIGPATCVDPDSAACETGGKYKR